MTQKVIYDVAGLFLLAFFVFFIIQFYRSIKLCFWGEGKSKAGLFFLSLFLNPLALMVETFLLASNILYKLYRLTESTVMQSELAFAVGSAVIYLVMILLASWLVGKYLGLLSNEPMRFLYFLFASIAVISVRDIGDDTLFATPYLGWIVDIVGNIIMFVAVWLLYRLDIRSLPKLSQVTVRINWKIFLYPPAIFSLLYAIFTIEETQTSDQLDDMLVFVIYIFSTLLVYLFIWVYHVIAENISALNENKILSIEVMKALAQTIDAKDEYTRGHSARVADYSRMLAEKIGLPLEDCENVYYMGLLHDIGKIGVPNEIINSTSKLTAEEYEVVKTHPAVGYDILAQIKSRPDLSIGARWHHERYDGKGYPDKKAGKNIPLLARIIAVADSYDAMTSNRSYRDLLPQKVVRSEIEKNAGTQFDPDIAACMISIIDEDKEYQLHE